jgi:uncharacterized membrane protein YesL
MDIWSSLLISILLLSASLGLMYWHARTWRWARTAALLPNELDFYRRQFRRRMQTSAMLGILALIIFTGDFLTRWLHSELLFTIYLFTMLLLVIWVVVLAAVDIWATQYHFAKLRQKCFIEQSKLQAEIQRVKSVRGNGKPPTKKDGGRVID